MSATGVCLTTVPASPESSDAGVVRRMQAGDQREFPAIYNRYHAKLFGMFYAILRDRSEAEELEQRTWYGFLVGVRNFDPTRDLWCWLRAIATRVLGRYRQKERRRGHMPLPGDDLPLPGPLTSDGPDAAWAEAEQRAAVNWVLSTFSQPDQELLDRRFVRRQRVVDIARAMGRNQRTVQSRITRLLGRARLQLAEYGRFIRLQGVQ